MRLPRTSIAAFMGFIVVLAVAFAALVRPTPLWAAVCFSGTMLALTYALVVALFARGRRRVFWTGFLIGGGSYLFLQYGPFCETQVGPYTLPTAALDVLYGALTIPSRQQPSLTALVTTRSAQKSPPAQLTIAGNPNTAFKTLSEYNLAAWVSPPAADPWQLWTATGPRRAAPRAATSPEFYRIGHSGLSLLVAVAFGLVARRVAERSERGRTESSPHQPGTLAAPGA
jgi:hypothetical protein